MRNIVVMTWILLTMLTGGYAQNRAARNSVPRTKDDEAMVRGLLKKIDADISDTSVYANEVVHMAQGSRAITSKTELAKVLKAEASYGKTVMTHELVSIDSYDAIVLIRGRVTGIFYPPNSAPAIPFETNNMMTFKRQANGSLKIWQVIFNRINLENEQTTKNPFRNFIGEWTLKNDDWSHNWGNGDEHIKIPHHHTVNRELNTAHTLLSVIDGAPPHGHIVWTYNPVKKEVHHLSSFGDTRIGVGQGTINENGDVTLKISFEGEAPGTYRIYTYKWLTSNSYAMRSDQFDSTGKPTGFFYGGTFVRITK